MNKAQISTILILYTLLFWFFLSKIELSDKQVQVVDEAITDTCINSTNSNKCFSFLYPIIEDRD